MIRRDWPLGKEKPENWLLIKQTVHARLSLELAQAWGGAAVPPVFCADDELDHPLAPSRQEFLQAVLHHDDGWQEWGEQPHIDPKRHRPYGFTEMPTVDSQRIWSDSIRQCVELGPLAGWVVASHFSALQSKLDDDYTAWIDWLRPVDAERAGWLAEWIAQSDSHTEPLAQQSLGWLQAFDWMSLWLCCQCPVAAADALCEPLVVGGDSLGGMTGWSEITFTPLVARTAEDWQQVRVSPWPFAVEQVLLEAEADLVPARHYETAADSSVTEGLAGKAMATRVGWLLVP